MVYHQQLFPKQPVLNPILSCNHTGAFVEFLPQRGRLASRPGEETGCPCSRMNGLQQALSRSKQIAADNRVLLVRRFGRAGHRADSSTSSQSAAHQSPPQHSACRSGERAPQRQSARRLFIDPRPGAALWRRAAGKSTGSVESSHRKDGLRRPGSGEVRGDSCLVQSSISTLHKPCYYI